MRNISTLFLLLVFLFSANIMSIETPEKFFGFKIGADRKLAHYSKIKDYFIKTGETSPKVKTVVMGKTTENRDMVMAIISSEENIASLDKYRAITRKLSLGEAGKEEVEQLAAQGKAVVMITCNLHSTEIGSSQMAVEILHKMAVDNSDLVKKILDKVIFLLVPSANPDGQAMVVEWYRKYLGTKYEGSSMPWLYHRYCGHDNNRDWYKINLKETWHITREMYHNWFPQIHVDEHQMGSSGDRFFVPPYADPPTPEVHPLVWRSINLIGSRISLDLEKRDYRGVAARGYFQGWWIGAMDDTAWFHNIPGILFEAASVNIATPVFVESEEVRSGESRYNDKRMFSPSPWKGGWWKLRDIIDYDIHATLAVLKHAADNSEEYLMNSWKMAEDSIRAGKEEKPFAYIIPANQKDSVTADRYIKTLLKSNIKIHKLKSPLKTGNYYFEKGSYIVPLAQAYRAFVKSIMGIQHYPDMRKRAGDSPTRPYDGAGWTLHYGMGVKAVKIDDPFNADMVEVKFGDMLPVKLQNKSGRYLIFKPEHNSSFMAAMYLLGKGVTVWRNYDVPELQKGAFIVERAEAWTFLEKLNRNRSVIADYRDEIDTEKLKKLKNFRVGLFQAWGRNMKTGWTRYVFDEFKVNYKIVRPADILKKGFAKEFDVLVFVNDSKKTISSGKPSSSYSRYYTPLPPEYKNGIGKKGLEVLKRFLKSGKTLVFSGRSWEYASESFKLRVNNPLKKSGKFSCPGSYLKVKIKESELTWGMDEEAAVYFSRAPVFSTSVPAAGEMRHTPVVMGMRDFLMSGYLEGEEELRRRALVVDYRKKRGRIVLLGPDFLHRAQTEGTYRIVFNSLFTAAVK